MVAIGLDPGRRRTFPSQRKAIISGFRDLTAKVRPSDADTKTVLHGQTTLSQLSGDVSHDWRPEGLTVRLVVPKDRIGT